MRETGHGTTDDSNNFESLRADLSRLANRNYRTCCPLAIVVLIAFSRVPVIARFSAVSTVSTGAILILLIRKWTVELTLRALFDTSAMLISRDRSGRRDDHVHLSSGFVRMFVRYKRTCALSLDAKE